MITVLGVGNVKKEAILIIGGDKRQEYVYQTLTADGYDCALENAYIENITDNITSYRYIILPVPASKNGKYIYSNNENFLLSFDSLCNNLTDKQIVFGGIIGRKLADLLDEKRIVYHDFGNNDDFLIYNAFLTAQGALRLLLESTEKSLSGKKALITGFGRIGKALAQLLNNLNLSVTVCARNENQLNLAECMGFNSLKLSELNFILTDTDYIFNTIPETVFKIDHIAKIRKDTIYFELASAPFGADKNMLNEYNVKYVNGEALPGRFTPESAGVKIAKTIENLI